MKRLVAIAFACLSACSLNRQDVPWEPLSLEAPIGLATRGKILALAGDTQECSALLQASDLEFSPIEATPKQVECSLEGAVALRRSNIAYGGPVRVSCPLAAALYIWEREVVQPAAREAFGVEVERIDHLGAYSCRRIYNRDEGAYSEHATANAIDVSAFRLKNGVQVRVSEHWDGDAASAAFLQNVRDGSCTIFSGVLGPDYNAAHRDHLHLDLGRYRICS